ncbi:hypothetical protein DIPPA_13828 [Diplonema papillatum]|nr:hypothetical protein DIPPA_13828 [Diplonema papillatum]|eukprot:gene12409-19190_t
MQHPSDDIRIPADTIDETAPILGARPRQARRLDAPEQGVGTSFVQFLKYCNAFVLVAMAVTEAMCIYYDLTYSSRRNSMPPAGAHPGSLPVPIPLSHMDVTVFILKMYTFLFLLTGASAELNCGCGSVALQRYFLRGQFYIFISLLAPVLTTQQVYGVMTAYTLDTLAAILLVAGVAYSIIGLFEPCCM